jgi:flagellar P-ring protein precursor FlgI
VLIDSKNDATVVLEATLPAAGVREGDRVDVHVSSIGPAKSLEGGRLFMIPMTGPLPNSPIYAYAAGAMTIESKETPTVGVVKEGAQLTRDIIARSMDQHGRITLVLNPSVACWPVASALASLVNDVVSPDGDAVARAGDPKNVVVQVPQQERADPAAFISQILLTYVDPSQIGTGARVVINERTGTIIVSGDVQISPVIISHKGLTITTITPELKPTPSDPKVEQNPFAAVDPEHRGGARLADLLSAFNQLKVEAADRIAILKEMDRSGKLHAQLILE